MVCCVLIVSAGLTVVTAAESNTSIDGTVDFVRPISNSGLELRLVSGTNCIAVNVLNAAGKSPVLSSRIRVTGGQPVIDGHGVSRLTVSGLDQIQFLTGSILPLVSNVLELRRLAVWPKAVCVLHLNGQVVAASSSKGMFAFLDDSGVAILEMKTSGRFVVPGQEIILEGNCIIEGGRLLLRNPTVVDDDGIHTMTEESGAIYLNAGKHPFRLDWFNHEFPYGLEVYIQGPDLPRQKVPDSILFRRETNSVGDQSGWVNGLDYNCYEGNWLHMPDFDRLLPTKSGTVTNFDLGVITRANDVGLQFTGYVEVPRDGIYNFTTISDDGSIMFIDENPPSIEVTGTNALPDPVIIAARQSLRADQDDLWSQVEGTVTFASEQSGSLELELSSDTGRMRVEVADSSGGSSSLLVNSRVRATGICLATRTTDGQSVAGKLLAPGIGQIQLMEVPAELWDVHPIIPIGRLAGMEVLPEAETIVHVRGKIHSLSDGRIFVEDTTGLVQLATTQPPPQNEAGLVEALGRWSRMNTNIVLQCAFYREIAGNPHEEPTTLPVLTTVEQIKRLPRGEWQRGYPVKIRGVITTVLDGGFFIQDSTRSIYARWWSPTDNDVPRLGDFWEIEGTTFAEFAPNIQVSRATRVGTGTLPEPLHPTWDQLMNGSLDTEYVEIQGIVTAVESDEITFLTRAGKINLELPDVQPQELPRYKNALVRIRGCVLPVRDIHTQQVVPGRMRLSNASLTVDELPPADPFAVTRKRASDLLLFDSRAGAFQRVKIVGQIVHEGDGQFFLTDGGDGLRVIPKSMGGLRVGDLVEAVGFPDLGGTSPILREAMVRRIRNIRLPDPVLLPSNAPLSRSYDATLVRVQARLAAISLDQADQVLELQSGTRGFVARLKISNGLLPAILPGSLLELTGVYAGQGSDLASGREIDSFELLLNSNSDVKILAHPSWWTVRHTLAVLGGMAFVILAALVWIALLHRQVEERSNELATEIRRHEQTERQRELEGERTRIARDLHDDLGATLTQIRFLSAVESRDSQLPETTRDRMGKVSEKSREMVASLDEIVWAVNPANDSLPVLANYLCHFAEEFFRPTQIHCRLDVDDSLPPMPLTSEVRHNLYLAVREALNNIAKHSRATEVWLRIYSRPPGEIHFIIEDNGCGFASVANTGNGLANMRQRLEKTGGRFEFETRPGAGVVCRFYLPVKIQSPPKREA